MCPPLTLTNGTSDCSERNSSVGDVCTITCNSGYELSGDSMRICQNNKTWTGTDSVCRLGKML